jgi:hypothetical protein
VRVLSLDIPIRREAFLVADFAIGGVSAGPAPVAGGSSPSAPAGQKTFAEMYREEVLRASGHDSMSVATTVPRFTSQNTEPLALRQTTDADLTAAGYDVDVLKANALNVSPMAYVSQFGDIPKYVVPKDLGRSTDYTMTVATRDDVAKTLANNAAFGFPVEIVDTESMPLRQVTDEDLIAAGYNVDVLKANALDVNLMAYVSQFGDIPKYVVPKDLGRSFDYTRTIATAEDLRQTFANNAAYGFPVEAVRTTGTE